MLLAHPSSARATLLPAVSWLAAISRSMVRLQVIRCSQQPIFHHPGVLRKEWQKCTPAPYQDVLLSITVSVLTRFFIGSRRAALPPAISPKKTPRRMTFSPPDVVANIRPRPSRNINNLSASCPSRVITVRACIRRSVAASTMAATSSGASPSRNFGLSSLTRATISSGVVGCIASDSVFISPPAFYNSRPYKLDNQVKFHQTSKCSAFMVPRQRPTLRKNCQITNPTIKKQPSV